VGASVRAGGLLNCVIARTLCVCSDVRGLHKIGLKSIYSDF